MPKLPHMSGAEAVRAFERLGWRRDRQRGSHVILLREGHMASLSIPQHRGARNAPGAYSKRRTEY